MKLGIVGLPNVGKSTLFNAITSTKNAEAANYPFCTIEPNSGIVAVPDKRLKAAHHVHDGVALADMAKELVAKAGALTCTLHKACNVHELHDGGGLFVGLPDLSQLVQPLVRHGHDAAVWLNGAEGVVGGFRVLGGGDGVEQSGLADVRQTDDTEFHFCDFSFYDVDDKQLY